MKKQFVKRITIDDVARMADVSKTTVSRYLNGNFDALAHETYARIKSAIETLGFRPNQMARGLKHRRSFIIGAVMADIRNPYSVAVLRNMEEVCKRHGYSLMVCNTSNDPEIEREYILRLQEQRIDGLLIATTGHNNEFLLQLAEERTAVVLIDRKVPELPFDQIVVNNEELAFQITNFLSDQGYQHIGFFTENFQGISTRQERLQGFVRAQNEFTSNCTGDIYIVNDLKLEQELDSFLYKTEHKSRVILAVNGVVLLKLVLALQKKGLRIPDDVAIASFDNLDWTPALNITVVEQPICEIGDVAAGQIIKRIEGNEEPVKTTILKGNLIVRGSTPLANTIKHK